ncbi:MAG: SLATT domain-containing protein, partial [bacterium]
MPPWSPPVLILLQDWRKRADAAALTHFRTAVRLSSLNAGLAIPVVVLTTAAGTSVFATLQEQQSVPLRIALGVVIVAAAILASLQAFFKFPERAEKHRIAGNRWAGFRREVDKMLSLHP